MSRSTTSYTSLPVLVLVLIWGFLVTCVETQSIFFLPTNQCLQTHEVQTYPLRVLEFRDCLQAGFLSPQWCTHFRQGFGSPYFGYYQPGFFYVASLLPEELRLVDRVAITSFAFAMVGYLFTYLTVARRFGILAGWLSATAMALSEYGWTNLCVRGDLSEFAATNLIPAVIFYLDGFLNNRRSTQFCGLAFTGALLIVTHSCVSLATFGYLGLFLGGRFLWTRFDWSSLEALAALLLSAGLAAFYWLPVMLEWNLIAVKNAFTGHYHYGNHFVEPMHLVVTRSQVVPTSIGLAMLCLLGFSIANVLVRWRRMEPGQQQLIAIAGSLSIFAMFLMSSASAFAWGHLPLLYRLQFPFRLLSLFSVGIALFIGCLPQWKSHTLRTLALIWFTGNLCYFTIFESTRDVKFMPFTEPHAAAELEAFHFGPDCEDEWLPRGAVINRSQIYPRVVIEGDGARATDYEQTQGKLTCHVETDRPSYVDLPHLYFPGWKATINDLPMTIHPNDDGRIRVDLPADSSGNLSVQFSMTPMRKLGLFVSLNSFVVLLGISLVSLWNRRATLKS